MNHSPRDHSGREAFSRASGRERLELSAENEHAPRELRTWHDRFAASRLTALLKERTHVKFRDLGSQRHETEKSQARSLVEEMAAAGALARLPALANRLGQAAAIAGESSASVTCFAQAAQGLPCGSARSVVLQNLVLVQLDRRDNAGALGTLAELARCAPLDMPLPADRYEIERPLGLSTFGMVFLCRELDTGRRVVVKSPPDSLPGKLPVLHEADILRRFVHSGVPGCLGQGFVDPSRERRPYYVIEWFDGLSLHEYVARFGPLSWANLQTLLTRLVETLRALHAQGVIHSDLKPGNVLVRCDHDGWQVKVIDFGIAVLADDPSAALVPNQPRPFTLGFGAPEQQGQSDQQRLTTAADLYAIGRTILFCLCGQPDPPPGQRDLLPAGLASLVAGCLAIDPNLRPSADELLQQLEALPAPDGPPRFPSTHLTAGTNHPSRDPGTHSSGSQIPGEDTRMPPRPPLTGP
ncbi:MAG: serine/threonine-protein kinase [Pirellulaceae bacterium]